MKAKAIFIAIVAIITNNFISSSIAQAEVITKKVTVSDFNKLTVEDNINVILYSGDQPGLSIEGNSKEVESVKVKQRGDELVISRDSRSSKQEPITVYVVTKNLKDLTVAGTASVQCDNALHTPVLSVLHTGTGNVKLKSDAPIVITVSSNHGRMVVEGNYANVVSRLDSYNRVIVAYSKEKSAS